MLYLAIEKVRCNSIEYIDRFSDMRCFSDEYRHLPANRGTDEFMS